MRLHLKKETKGAMQMTQQIEALHTAWQPYLSPESESMVEGETLIPNVLLHTEAYVHTHTHKHTIPTHNQKVLTGPGPPHWCNNQCLGQ